MFAASKTASVSGGYQISRSLRFNSADSAYLNRTPASATNRKTWTWSGWVKRSTLIASGGAPQNIFGARDGNYTLLRFNYFADPGNTIRLEDSGFSMITLPVYRDVSAWYHIVLAVDTTQATNTNRVKLYVNNVLQTFDGTYTSYPTQNYDTQVNNNIAHNIGAQPTYGDYFNGYMTEVNFIDGSQLTPSSFGETNAQTGVWTPIAYSGSYGTNGFYLNFSDNSNTTAATLGKDYSGNGNNWTPNNFSVTAGAGNDSLVDSPTSYGTDTGVGGTVRGNYATLNPLLAFGTSTFTNGNLDVSVSSLNTNNLATIAIPTSGKWYWEYQITSIGGGGSPMGGVASTSSNSPAIFYRSNGDKLVDGTSSAYGATYTTTDIVGVAVDTDGGTITFYKNGSSQGAVTYATSSGSFFSALRSNAATDTFTVNFGQRAFAYTAPSGYKALCTQNLPTPTIGATTATLATSYFNPVLYTGTGATRTVTGVNFAPDLVWIKSRSAAYNNRLYDKVRGVENVIQSNSTAAEGSDGGGLTAFGSDGFTLGSSLAQNESGSTFVAWNWKANGSGVTNTAGSITSTVSANTTSGFSIVTYTGNGTGGATVGHGLGVAPSMVICKTRTGSSIGAWQTYHSALGATKTVFLNLSDAAYTNILYWNNTAPTSSVFTIGANTDVNTITNTYVAYCFAEVAGYSKMGSWTGNGSSTGPFIYTGFRPAFVLVKNTTSAGPQWWILDNKRNVYNPEDLALPPSLSLADQTIPTCLNFLSNGFQITTTNGDFNASGSNYVYMAFAENPFKYSLAR